MTGMQRLRVPVGSKAEQRGGGEDEEEEEEERGAVCLKKMDSEQ